jgi:hypothetical protein
LVPVATVLAGLCQVGAAAHEETPQGLVVDLRREPRQLLTLRIRQEPDRRSANPATTTVGPLIDEYVGF